MVINTEPIKLASLVSIISNTADSIGILNFHSLLVTEFETEMRVTSTQNFHSNTYIIVHNDQVQLSKGPLH